MHVDNVHVVESDGDAYALLLPRSHLCCCLQAAELTGHTARVLHMAQSPDGSSVVTAGADETLRFWKVFGEPPTAKADKEAAAAGGAGGMMRTASIR